VYLSALGSVMLLASTNLISQDIAVIPFFWIVPLSLYLFSFIICFGSESWYLRKTFYVLFALGSVFAAGYYTEHYYDLITEYIELDIAQEMGFVCLLMFLACLICHGELFRIRPNKKHLTAFYLYVSLGGALGGVFVNLIAPNVFMGYWEFPISLFLILVFSTSKILSSSNIFSSYKLKALQYALVAVIAAPIAGGSVVRYQEDFEQSIAASRNFYGVLSVKELTEYYRPLKKTTVIRQLTHGTINHGTQFVDETLAKKPISYYHPKTGLRVALEVYRELESDKNAGSDEGIHIGVIGLGTGTLAAVGQENDRVRFYEIDQNVIDFSNEYFTYIKDSKADVDIVLGDARISLEKELHNNQSQKFDVLVLDAFSSDAIPIHLLTVEAFQVYWKHMKKDGVIIVHITNRYLDLHPVMVGISNKLGLMHGNTRAAGRRIEGYNTAVWAILTKNQKLFEHEDVSSILTRKKHRKATVWTDKNSNLFEVFDY